MARQLGKEQWEQMAGMAIFNARELARLRGLSLRQLERLILRDLGRTPQEWLNEQRIIEARKLLLSGQSVKMVAFQLGFKQPSHFCRQFKALSSMTPSEFVASTPSGGECRSWITNVVDR
jgi:AraC-like DNA-binding protein